MTERGSRGWLAYGGLAVIAVLLAFGLRAAALTRMPLFVDEVLHITRAHNVLAGDLFIGLINQKWLYTVILALFEPTGPEALFVARMLSALCGAVTVAAGVGLGRTLGGMARGVAFGRWAGLIAGLFAAVLPLAVIHERMALVDPMMAAFTGVSALAAVRLARRPDLPQAVLVGALLTGAILTKALGLVYIVVPLAAAVFLARRPERVRALEMSLVAVALALLATSALYTVAGEEDVAPSDTHRVSLGNTVFAESPPGEVVDLLIAHLRDTAEAIWAYVGPVGLVLIALAVVWIAIDPRLRGPALFLFVPAFAIMIGPVLAEQVTEYGDVPPRYFVINTMPIAALAGLSLAALVDRLAGDRSGRRAVALAGTALAAGVVLPALAFDAALIRNPQSAPFITRDVDRYFVRQPVAALRGAADVLRAEWEAAGRAQIHVMGPEDYRVALEAYLGPGVGRYRNYQWDTDSIIVHAMAEGEPAFAIVEDWSIPMLRELGVTDTEFVASLGPAEVWRIRRVEGPIVEDIAARMEKVYPLPPDDGRADLVAALAQDSGAGDPLIVYPSGEAAALGAETGRRAVPLDVAAWPPAPGDVPRGLMEDINAPDGAPVDVVIVQPDVTDPEAGVRLGFQQRLYRTGQIAWYGIYATQPFVTGPANPNLTPLGVVFEDAIYLDAAAALSEGAGPGGVVRVVLRWWTEVPVQDSFHMFAHVVDAAGTLVSQHDAVPGAGLLPLTAWTPGERVEDRFAIRLPSNLPAGDYAIWVGLYNPDNGLRLAVTEGAAGVPDHALVGRFAVP
jgi:hypothetical protein